MKKIFLFLLIAAPLLTFAQTGFGIYPWTGMASVRWNPKTVSRDSSGVAHFVTNYKLGFEVRSFVSIKHTSSGTNFSAVPELVVYRKFRGEEHEPMLLSGAGVFTSISHGNVVAGGFFIPFIMFWQPEIHNSSHLYFIGEVDGLFSFTSSRQSFGFRPLIGCGWTF
ncbi:MAG TPA: hypothetical protein VL651_11860 [Bacteroidia bacterium]|jgi:hypothetical protein|nr:hypothetical protein [Bacteroidia bacterium]